jgi:hypothetical protein
MQSLDFIVKSFQETGKRPLVLLSGGLDSTYLVSELLKQIPVDTMYIKASLLPQKAECELLARQKIIDYFNANNDNKIVKDNVHDIGHAIVMGTNLPQPLFWFYAAMTMYNSDIHSCVCIGYVTGDAVCQYLDRLEAAWNQINPVVKKEHVPLLFPLRNLRKRDILTKLPAEIEKMTLVCERPFTQLQSLEALRGNTVHIGDKHSLPKEGVTGTIYVTELDNNREYRWMHNQFVEVFESTYSTLEGTYDGKYIYQCGDCGTCLTSVAEKMISKRQRGQGFPLR